MELSKGTGNHKWKVKINGKTIQFGAKGYTDYTLGAGDEKKQNYITRHKSRENWNKSGLYTAGFWKFLQEFWKFLQEFWKLMNEILKIPSRNFLKLFETKILSFLLPGGNF
jgi:hypothetical protein